MYRDNTRVINIGGIKIGGGNPVAIQSMTNTKTSDASATIEQIYSLEKAGCDIVRCAVPDMEAAKALKEIKKAIHIPLVADIHFDYKLAIAAIENGADKIRINPGNIGSKDKVRAVASAAKEWNIPIRVGVNSGSLEKEIIKEYGGVTAEGLVKSALLQVKAVEDMGYDNLVISIKSSDVLMCIKAHEIIAKKTDYPLHVGITESGTILSGNIKVVSAKLILRTLGLRKGGVTVVSCPTCGRTQINLIKLACEVESMVQDIITDKELKVAVMGCAVNGPGEAKEADLGIAGGKGEGLLIRKGEIIKKVPEDKLLYVLKEEIFSELAK